MPAWRDAREPGRKKREWLAPLPATRYDEHTGRMDDRSPGDRQVLLTRLKLPKGESRLHSSLLALRFPPLPEPGWGAGLGGLYR